MIGRKVPKIQEVEAEPKGFDAYDLRLGDMMRGERATMGKSLLDVQRELRIKASYIAAIENCDPGAFDTPGFIAGYVRSYARYLNMDPDEAFAGFCAESGFSVAHGMSAEASVIKKPSREERLSAPKSDIFAAPATPFVPSGESILSRVEPGAIGSSLVLLALIGGLGFGGWTVLQEVQRVQVAPVDATPVVLSEVDPLQGAAPTIGAPAAIEAPQPDALDRLYRPQALDVPVLTPRDGAIAGIDPQGLGNFAAPEGPREGGIGGARLAGAQPNALPGAGAQDVPAIPQVVEAAVEGVRIIASTTSWVRVRSPEGNVLYEGTMIAGDTYDLPQLEGKPTMHTGNAGAIYFAMGNDCYGPAGTSGEVYSGISLERTQLAQAFELVPPSDPDSDFHRMVADMRSNDPGWISNLPCQIN
ncbi:MAG: RodZ domain-containing protein [Pseudomonadota bacterium]